MGSAHKLLTEMLPDSLAGQKWASWELEGLHS